jgi:hypothetical protein
LHFLHSFGRIGTFQWVTANPNKKISSHLNSRARLRSERANSIRLRRQTMLSLKPRRIDWQNICSMCFRFWQENASGQMPRSALPHFGCLGLRASYVWFEPRSSLRAKRSNPGERRARTFSGLLRCCAPRNDNSILPSRENLETGRDQTPSPSVPVGGLIQSYFSAFPIRFSTVSRNKMLVDL